MKKFKKLAGIMLALVMVLAMAVPVFADNVEGGNTDTNSTETGTITINEPVTGETYKIYQMFTLESYDATAGNYSYKPLEAWNEFITSGYGKDYFEVNTNGYVVLKSGVSVADDSDTAAQIAQEALKYAASKSIQPTATLPHNDSYTASDLPLGYYLVDSSLGALCGLTTTKPNATVNEKNAAPTVEKLVYDDILDSWDDNNTATIGDVVKYRTTITVQEGAQSYVLYDKFDNSLDLIKTTTETPTESAIKVQREWVDETGQIHYDDLTNECTVDTIAADNYTFKITFKDDYVSTLDAGSKIIVTYSAKLNKDAVISGGGNVNTTWLAYGDKSKTKESKATTYTYQFDVVKTDSSNALLNGATFQLLDKNDNVIGVVKEADGNYRVAVDGETAVLIEAGKATVKGLGNGDYKLKEIAPPTGYNLLTTPQAFSINNANLTATMSEDNPNIYVNGGVRVINNTGTELPSTGGVGTTIFYIVGGILVVGAGVLLVARKRMNTEKKAK